MMRPMIRSPRGVVSVVLLGLALAGCDAGDTAGPAPTPVPFATDGERRDVRLVGLVGTMSGPGGWRGEDAFEGADLGVQALNEELDEGEPPFELRSLDDRGDPARAVELVRQLAGLERTVGIIYAGPPFALTQAEAALARAGIPALLCYGDLYGARALSAHVFQVSPSLVWEARRLAAYLLGDRGYVRVGLLAGSDRGGALARAALSRAFAAQRARRPVVVRYDSASEVTGALDELEAARVQAIVVHGTPELFGDVADELAARGATYVSSAAARAARRGGKWRPQLAGFDQAIGLQVGAELPAGTVAAESLARGVHYLPVPSFRRFRRAFQEWWDAVPLGWEQRAYEAARAIGWAARRGGPGEDLAVVLEGLRGRRFGGLTVTLGPDDHTAVDQLDIGLWVVPSPAAEVPERARLPAGLPWVPLARSFTIDGERLFIAPRDWRYLVRRPQPRRAPAPRFNRLRFGVTTPRSDPVH